MLIVYLIDVSKKVFLISVTTLQIFQIFHKLSKDKFYTYLNSFTKISHFTVDLKSLQYPDKNKEIKIAL